MTRTSDIPDIQKILGQRKVFWMVLSWVSVTTVNANYYFFFFLKADKFKKTGK